MTIWYQFMSNYVFTFTPDYKPSCIYVVLYTGSTYNLYKQVLLTISRSLFNEEILILFYGQTFVVFYSTSFCKNRKRNFNFLHYFILYLCPYFNDDIFIFLYISVPLKYWPIFYLTFVVMNCITSYFSYLYFIIF